MGRENLQRMADRGIVWVPTAVTMQAYHQSLTSLLEKADDINIVGEAKDGQEAVELVEQLKPDVLIIDIAMPRLNGIQATQRLRRAHPDLHVLVLTTYAEDQWVLDAIRAGASGYLLKDTRRDALIDAVKGTIEGKANTYLQDVQMIPEAGHMMPLEASDQLNAVLLEYLKDRPRPFYNIGSYVRGAGSPFGRWLLNSVVVAAATTLVGYFAGGLLTGSRQLPVRLAALARDPEFLRNFEALDARPDAAGGGLANAIVSVKAGSKTEAWQIDSISGATISSRAVARMLDDSAQQAVPVIMRHLEAFGDAAGGTP